MKRIGSAALLVLALQCTPAVARAQLGEVHLGAFASYGTPNSIGPGGGIVIGVATGRLTYLGVRWGYHGGSSEREDTESTSAEVTSRLQMFTVDLGFLLPAGSVEIVPAVSLGAARFAQRNLELGKARATATEFVAAPGLSVQTRFSGLLLIPEIQYVFASDPELPRPVQHRGPIGTMRIVFALEVGRFRH